MRMKKYETEMCLHDGWYTERFIKVPLKLKHYPFLHFEAYQIYETVCACVYVCFARV